MNASALAVNSPMISDFQHGLHDVLVERARSLRPLLAANAQKHEELGELVPEVVEALAKADFFKMCAPRRCGGLSISSLTLASVYEELAQGCPSAAWVVSIINSCIWTASLETPAMQKLIFAHGVPLVCSPQNPVGSLVERDGKYFVSGSWPYSSGSHHSEWAIAPVKDAEAVIKLVALRMADVAIENSWHVAGMKGTGSDTIVAKDVEVTKEQLGPMFGTEALRASRQGAFAMEASDYWVLITLMRTKMLGTLIGAAVGLLECAIATKDRPILYTTYAKRSDSEVWQAEIGKAAGKINVARTIVHKHCRINDHRASEGGDLTLAERALNRVECAISTDLLIEACEKLMSLIGSSAFMTKSPAQRFWRDFSIGMRHFVYNTDLGYQVYGCELAGKPITVVDAVYL